jgi:maltooligosyltrehalose trehalohydrolase
MGWDPDAVPNPQDPQAFRRSKLDWAEAAGESNAKLLGLYRELAELRRTVPELTDPRFADLDASFDDETGLFRLDRAAISILVNFGDLTQPIGIPGDVLLTTSGNRSELERHSAVILSRG